MTGELIIIVFLYLLPALIASSRKHNNSVSITLTNLIFGWTVIGWLIAFIWAFSKDVKKK